MKIQIDIKSMLCGLVLGVATMFVLGASSVSSDQFGRYQVTTGQSASIIIDTATGRAWGFQPANTGQFRNDANFGTRSKWAGQGASLRARDIKAETTRT